MSTIRACRRRTPRFRLPPPAGATIELAFPARDSRRWRLDVVDLSASGLSFRLDDDFPAIDAGTGFDGVVMTVGDCVIRGEILVMHVTQRPGDRRFCGGLFYPATDEDLIKLRSLLSGLRAAAAD